MLHLMGRIRRDGLYSTSRLEFPLTLQMRAAIRLEASPQVEDESTIPGLSMVASQAHERRTQFVSTVISQHSFGENVAVAAGAIAQ